MPVLPTVTASFSVNWDYRCPFARIAHKNVLWGLRGGADWDVEWVPFSLRQVHVEDGEPSVWDHPESDSGLLALQVGLAVRDLRPDCFPVVHEALFDARHVDDRDLRQRDVLTQVLADGGVDPQAILDHVDDGKALAAVREEHERSVETHDVWGVPTFASGDRAVFVRLMETPTDTDQARDTVDRVLDLMTGWPALNEFKATTRQR